MPYDPAEIEPRWQAWWFENKTFRTPDTSTKPKYYVLDMFPYPSGAGLHVGHPEGYTATDILARWKRMLGFNVLHPMGWDAFGLPAERAAVRDGIHPAIITRRNVENFKRQIKRLGFSYDWDREVSTTDPSYYRWTQWIFLKLFEMGLAYQAEIPVNWCPALGTVLSNEEVKDGKYVETGDAVERRQMKQWMLRITKYAERLAQDLDGLDWPEPVKKMQREWIGRSEGAEITFHVSGHHELSFVAFTTRPDTLFGATFCVLAPEHPLVAKITDPLKKSEVETYVARAAKMSDRDRSAADAKEFTGVWTGAYAVSPLANAKLPIYIADYVLAGYGTGAIMSVPGHDDRDYAFARKFDLPVRCVVRPANSDAEATVVLPYLGEGVSIESGRFTGLSTAECKQAVIRELEKSGAGHAMVTYKLRDWLFSRQRYWGEPFPLVTLADGTVKPLPLDELPVELPQLDDFKPTADGQPPLARAESWVATTDPATGQPARRETNTMPQWAGSCWYYLRYLDPKNERALVDPAKEKYWMPVDLYVGGTEHAVLHLLYARFWHKVLFDAGIVSTKEPFQKLFNQGMILAWSFQDDAGKYYHPHDVVEKDGKPFHKTTGIPLKTQVEKMSKSRLNVVSPDEIIADFGADAMRLYEMFMGPLEIVKPWQTKDIEGVARFLQRVWRLVHDEDDRPNAALTDAEAPAELRKATHRAIAGVTEDLEGMRFNTAISKMMVLVNELTAANPRPKWCVERLVLLLAPFAPHIAEEIWQRLGHADTLAYEPWPQFDAADLVEATVTLPVSINGKLKEKLEVPRGADQATVEKMVLSNERVQRSLAGKPVRKVIYVEGRMVNLVV